MLWQVWRPKSVDRRPVQAEHRLGAYRAERRRSEIQRRPCGSQLRVGSHRGRCGRALGKVGTSTPDSEILNLVTERVHSCVVSAFMLTVQCSRSVRGGGQGGGSLGPDRWAVRARSSRCRCWGRRIVGEEVGAVLSAHADARGGTVELRCAARRLLGAVGGGGGEFARASLFAGRAHVGRMRGATRGARWRAVLGCAVQVALCRCGIDRDAAALSAKTALVVSRQGFFRRRIRSVSPTSGRCVCMRTRCGAFLANLVQAVTSGGKRTVRHRSPLGLREDLASETNSSRSSLPAESSGSLAWRWCAAR